MDRPGRLVLLGHPVGHSLSPRMQNAALRSAGIPLEYAALDVLPERLPSTLDALVADRAAGNVTIPHKEAVAARATLTALARRVGAVNTFWVREGVLHGDNTDVGGFDSAARELVGGLPRGTIAILGAGGAAAAVLAAVERWPDSRARVHGRSEARARALCARFAGLADLAPTAESAVAGASLVVNATPVGLSGDEYPAPLETIAPGAAVIDLVYRAGGTAWSRAAAERGHPACDGLSMLVEQGALAFERWFGVPADRPAMWKAIS
jgi:shikimate dehydrogenase